MRRGRLQLPHPRQRLPGRAHRRGARCSSAPTSRSAGRTAPTRSCSCTPTRRSRRRSSCRSRETSGWRSPATARTRSTRRSRAASRAAARSSSRATVHKLTGLKINHVLYVDLAGFQGVVDTLGGVDMCIPAENVNTPDGRIVDELTALDVTPGCQRLPGDQALAYVRTRHLRCDAAAPGLLSHRSPAAVPAGGDQQAAAARSARAVCRS